MKNKTPIVMGVAAALFFAVTFIVNRLMSLSGSSWIWSASLRFFWMLPMLLAIVSIRGGLQQLIVEIKKNKKYWLIWSTIGFGFFYAPLTFSAAYSPSWLLASTWQVTIVAGMIVAPFVKSGQASINPDKHSAALYSGIIILGIIVMQVGQARSLSAEDLLKCIIPVTIAAFAYPLGNRKMMLITDGKLDVFQRLLGMVLCSMPFWLLLTAYEVVSNHTLPQASQLQQTLIVAVFSGVFATALFFSATDKVSGNESKLAAVEATQSTEVLFAVVGEVIILGIALPDIYGISGIVLVISGMLLHSYKT